MCLCGCMCVYMCVRLGVHMYVLVWVHVCVCVCVRVCVPFLNGLGVGGENRLWQQMFFFIWILCLDWRLSRLVSVWALLPNWVIIIHVMFKFCLMHRSAASVSHKIQMKSICFWREEGESISTLVPFVFALSPYVCIRFPYFEIWHQLITVTCIHLAVMKAIEFFQPVRSHAFLINFVKVLLYVCYILLHSVC